MMTVQEAIRLGTQTLAAAPDPKLDAVALLANVFSDRPLAMYMRAQENLTPEQEARYRALLLLRAQRRPLQYMLGTQCFYGYDFRVDQRVLIPRQETELLCEHAIKALEAYTAPKVLDVCTGSGAIAVVIKRECLQADVTAVDISEDALAVARENANHNHARIRFMQGDLLVPVAGEQFDLIVSNPPYIASHECDTLQPEVLYEPRLALDGGVDGLDFYRRLITESPALLSAGGWLMMEVGDQQARQVSALLAAEGTLTDVHIHEDYRKFERFVTARRAAFPT